MKPYNIEIFDRQFNFLYSTLLDEKDFSYSFDAVSPVKNTVTVPTDFKPTELSNEPRAPKGWYIRIVRDNEEYQGVISGFEGGDTKGIITYSQLMTLFDTSIWVISQEITNTTIESYIRQILTSTFINNSDTLQNITGLSVTYSGSTQGSLDYCNTDEVITTINLLDDLINKAYSTYGIYTKVTANFGSKSINVNIAIISAAERTIEGDLPNITNATFTVRKTTGVEVNKVSLKDAYSGLEYTYYLYDDGTFGTDANPVGKTRVYPVVSETLVLNTYELAKSVVDEYYQGYLDILKNYSSVERDLTANELSLLQSACNVLMPKYEDLIGFNTYSSFNKIYYDFGYGSIVVDFNAIGGVNIYQSVRIIQSSYQNPSSGWDGKFPHYGSSIATMAFGPSYDEQYNFYGHAVFKVPISQDGTYSDEWSTITGGFSDEDYIPFNYDNGNKAITAYKQTYAYEQEVLNQISGAGVTSVIYSKAVGVFSKNKYSNLIELTVKQDDPMINPMDMVIGQTVNVIHEGVSYNSILSGREVGKGLVKLIFGTIRLELTKLLNMKGV